MSTIQVNRWRIYCTTEGKYLDGYMNRDSGEPSTCFNNDTHSIDSSKNKLIEVITNDYTPCVIKWRVYCTNEDDYVEGYSNEDYGIPTKCYNNNTHVLSGSPEKVEIIRNPIIEIKEEARPTQGRLKVETIKMDILPNETAVLDKSWDINIAPLSVNILCTDANSGDTFQADVAPDKILGFLTQNVTIGDTIIYVSPTVMENISTGFLCSLSDGVNSDNLGIVTYINRVTNSITVQNSSANSYLSTAPTYVKITVRYLGPHEFGNHGGTILMGGTKLGASFVPKNEIVRLTYVNNSTNYKSLYAILEYLY